MIWTGSSETNIEDYLLSYIQQLKDSCDLKLILPDLLPPSAFEGNGRMSWFIKKVLIPEVFISYRIVGVDAVNDDNSINAVVFRILSVPYDGGFKISKHAWNRGKKMPDLEPNS